jgi:Effector protein
MAVYQYQNGVWTHQEQHLYGADRLGVHNKPVALPASGHNYMFLATKKYELTNHLGNVMAVVTDRRFVHSSNGFATAEVVNATDYFVFGSAMPSREYNGSAYDFGFNTQMESPEILPGHTTAMYWEYDARIGRRWELDPKTVTGWSGYACLGDNPIMFNDVLGDTLRLNLRSGFLGLGKKTPLNFVDGDLYHTDGAAFKGELRGFSKAAYADLVKLNDSNAGHEILSEIENSTIVIKLVKVGSHGMSEASFSSSELTVAYTPGVTPRGITENGGSSGEAFLTLGHELSHAQDYVKAMNWQRNRVDFSLENPYFNKGEWFSLEGRSVPKAEIYATHMENRLRGEFGFPLRTHYAVRGIDNKGSIEGAGPSILVKGTSISVYYHQFYTLTPKGTHEEIQEFGGYDYRSDYRNSGTRK